MKLPYTEYHYDLEFPLTERLLQWNHNTNPAIVCEGRELSYREMNQIADSLAARLMEKGIKKGDIVAVDMCRSERYICSVYGIMRSGGCCLPMEHTWPEKRKQLISETSGAVYRITEEDYAAMMADGLCTPKTRVTCQPDDNAIIIFTSGSTGVPKGIFRNYKQLNFLASQPSYRQHVYPWLHDMKRAPCFITFATSAGMSMFIIEHALGHTCWLLSDEESRSPRTVGQAVLDLGLQDLVVLPAFIRAGLQDEVFCSALHQLKDFRLAGGSLTQDLADELRAVCPQLQIWNGYGMTEVGTIAAGYVGDDMKKIGKPVPNILVAILDEKGLDVGVNEPGEICVGSQAMTKVYMNAPELNLTRYFVHPEYGPLFRTGDLGRGDKEGNLYVLGRLDRMVKIREVRIELDEIERTISSFPGVKQGLSAVHGPDNDRFIVGYYLSDEVLDEDALRRHILSILPQPYMPRYLMRLETIPITATGKVAYPQLPVPEAGAGIVYEAPETQEEHSLAQVLGEVLKLPPEKVSMRADFARLGGDSLRAMIVSSRLREQGWILQPNILYSDPTLRQAAGRMKPAPETQRERCLAQVLSEVLRMPVEQVSMSADFERLGGDSILAMITCSRLRGQGWILQPNMLHSEPTLRQAAGRMKPASKPPKPLADTNLFVRCIPLNDLRMIAAAAGGENNVEAILHLTTEISVFYHGLKKNPSSGAYHLAAARLSSVAFTRESFCARVRDVVSCHPALRSLIVVTELNVACQVVLRDREPSCYYQDLRYLADGTDLPNKKQLAVYNMYLNYQKTAARTVEEALIPRFLCFRFADRLCGVGYICSHAFLDGWSGGILLNELAAVTGPTETDHYIDYMDLRRGKNKAKDLCFWREYLKGVELEKQILPMKQEWANGTTRFRCVSLGRDLSGQIDRYGKDNQISPPVLLHYLTGRMLCEVLDREELVLKICLAARGADVPREEQIIGNLMRICPVRLNITQSLKSFYADLRMAEQHMSPSLNEILASAGLWTQPVWLTLTTTALPDADESRENELNISTTASIPSDTLIAVATCTPDDFSVQYSYNPLIFAEDKLDRAEVHLTELAHRLLNGDQL